MSSIWLRNRNKSVTSQNGEDGVLEAIFETIGATNKWCCEFGAWDGKTYSDCYNLIHNHGWHGVLLEGDKTRADALTRNREELGDVVIINSYIQS
jgi:hypothetical protein